MRIRSVIVATSAAVVAVLSWSGAASAGGGCLHGTPVSDGTGTTVEIVDMCFTPTVLHVDPGTAVTAPSADGASQPSRAEVAQTGTAMPACWSASWKSCWSETAFMASSTVIAPAFTSSRSD